jgi:uncharacterized protein
MIKRQLSGQIKILSRQYPVLAIVGPRQSGKTTLSRMLFPKYHYINLEQMDLRHFAKEDPVGFFKTYPPPLILDEIQKVPELISQIQVESDRINKDGQFILTGSHQLSLMESVTQSLAGRVTILTLFPFSLEELAASGISNRRDEAILKGGMPRLYDKGIKPSTYYRDYLRTYIERDVRNILNIRHLDRFEIFLKLLAGRVGQLLKLSSLSADVGISGTTLAEWITVLESSHIIFKLRPWYGNIGKRLTKSPKIYFTDTGLAAQIAGIETPEQLMRDPLRGNLFENMVILEVLKKKLNRNDSPNLYFFRTESGLEIDLLEKKGSSLIPYEIKSADTLNPDFFKALIQFQKLSLEAKSSSGGIIYSGPSIIEYKGFRCLNFAESGKAFA